MPDFDYKAAAFFLSLVNSCGLLAAFLLSWLTNRQKANTKTIRELEDKTRTEMNRIDDRLIRVEECLDHLPTHGDVETINRRIDELGQELRKVEGMMTQINNSVQLIHKHLLNQAK